jgi:hypothetical protein
MSLFSFSELGKSVQRPQSWPLSGYFREGHDSSRRTSASPRKVSSSARVCEKLLPRTRKKRLRLSPLPKLVETEDSWECLLSNYLFPNRKDFSFFQRPIHGTSK